MHRTLVSLSMVLLSACNPTGSNPMEPVNGQHEGSPQCVPETPISDIAPRQTVRFDVRYSGTSPAWVVSEGHYCGPVQILTQKGSLSLTEPYQVVCEGPPPPAPTVKAAVKLAGRVELAWDGRALSSYHSCYDCDPAWPGMGEVPQPHYAARPVGPGVYRARVAILDLPPARCYEEAGHLRCPESWDWFGGYGTGDETCPADRYVEVSFVLPPTGDIVVPVQVPPRHQLETFGPTALDRPTLRPVP